MTDLIKNGKSGAHSDISSLSLLCHQAINPVAREDAFSPLPDASIAQLDSPRKAGLEAAAEAIRTLQTWQAFKIAHETVDGDWAMTAALYAVRAYLAETHND
jgi:hypothetical protein